MPSIIGGDETRRRGIVLAKSPVAKKYGIKTAETLYEAKKKCPKLEVYPPDYYWYSKKSKELFSYIESDVPFIFGINQKYSNTFFDDNKINLKKKIVCIVDLDEKKYEIIPNNYNVKENPEYPKHFKEKTENTVKQTTCFTCC